MKTLLLLRHAKAEGDAPDGDIERALTARGRRDAKTMGEKIASLVPKVDLFVTSNARRAQQTAVIAADAADYSGKIEVDKDIYYTDVDNLMGVVQGLPGKAKCVVLVGHNPSFSEFASELATSGAPEVSLATAGVAHLAFDVDRWPDVRPGTGHLLGVYKPKEVAAEGE